MMASPNLQKFGSDNFKGDISFGIIINFFKGFWILVQKPFLYFNLGLRPPVISSYQFSYLDL